MVTQLIFFLKFIIVTSIYWTSSVFQLSALKYLLV